MKDLIRKILKEEQDELGWMDNVLASSDKLNKYDYTDDSADMKVGDRVIFAPNIKGYPYERCAGKIMNERTVKVFDEHTFNDMEETEFEIGKIKCNPESYKFPNNHVTTRTDSEWFGDHYWYITNKNWYIAKKYKTPDL